MKGYLSLIFSLIPNVIAVLIAALATGHITEPIAIGIVIAILQPAVVAISPNLPDALYVKAALAGLLAGAQVVVQLIGAGGLGGFTVAQWTMIVGAILAAAGVILRPNQPPVQVAKVTRPSQSGQASLRFAGLLALLLLIVAAYAAGASPNLSSLAHRIGTAPTAAHALGGACGAFDSDGVLYDEPQSTSVNVIDIAHGGFTFQVASDLHVYRYGTGGHCYRGAYSSIWTNHNEHATIYPVVRAWICGIGPYNFPGTVLSNVTGNYMITTSSWSFYEVSLHVTLPNGQVNWLTLARYDGCGPQFDNYPGYADGGIANWAPTPINAAPGRQPSLYLNR